MPPEGTCHQKLDFLAVSAECIYSYELDVDIQGPNMESRNYNYMHYIHFNSDGICQALDSKHSHSDVIYEAQKNSAVVLTHYKHTS